MPLAASVADFSAHYQVWKTPASTTLLNDDLLHEYTIRDMDNIYLNRPIDDKDSLLQIHAI